MAMKWQPFSHYEKQITDVMVANFTPHELDDLTEDQIDQLRGKILTVLVDAGHVTPTGIKRFYSSLTAAKTNGEA